MSHPDQPAQGQPAAHQHQGPADWRTEITRLQFLDGWRLLPVNGKAPCGAFAAGWSDPENRPQAAAVIAEPTATGFGLITGPQHVGGSVVAFDFDGVTGEAWALQQPGIATQNGDIDPPTWQIRRIDADGHLVPGRFKVLWRVNDQQLARLGGNLILKFVTQRPPKNSPTGTKGEAVEVFHHTGRQVVLLGAHPDGGHYFWPETRGPEALAELPDAWFNLLRAVAEYAEAGRGDETREQTRARHASSTGGDWRRMRRNEQCPVCGRTAQHSGESHICAVHKHSGAIRCFDGSTFSYRATHPNLTRGGRVPGLNRTVYAFTSEAEAFGIGMRGNFVIDKPRDKPPLPETPQPWTEPVNTGDWTADLIAGIGNGNGHSDEPPAAEQVIDVVVATGAQVTEASLQARMRALCDRIERIEGPGTAPEHWGSEPYFAEFQATIIDATADLQERRGAELPTVQRMARELFGINQPDWRQLIKPKLLELQQRRRDLQALVRQQQAAERTAIAVQFDGDTPPKGQEHKPLLAEMGAGPNDGKRMPLGDLVRRLQDVAARPLALRRNLITSMIEYTTAKGSLVVMPPDGVDLLYVHLAHCGYETTKQAAGDALLAVAKQDTYNPVQEWLNLLLVDPTIPAIDLQDVAPLVFGLDDERSRLCVRKTLIGAVARAMAPGSRMSSVLVLKGAQDTDKSAVWPALVPNPDWVIDTIPKDDKDFLVNQHRTWIYELAEMEQLFSKNSDEQLKSKVTSTADMVRLPYASAPQKMPRHSIMVGTCNTDDFLVDRTGNKRYWVLDTDAGTGISPAAAADHHLAIWKAAATAWMNRTGNCDWWLDAAQKKLVEQGNAAFIPQGRFDDLLEAWINRLGRGACFTVDVALINSGSVPEVRLINDRERREAGAALRGMGWAKKRARIPGGRVVHLWHREGQEPCLLTGLQAIRTSGWQ